MLIVKTQSRRREGYKYYLHRCKKCDLYFKAQTRYSVVCDECNKKNLKRRGKGFKDGDRILVSGTQISMLKQIENDKERIKLLNEIIEKQYIGFSKNSLLIDIKTLKGKKENVI